MKRQNLFFIVFLVVLAGAIAFIALLIVPPSEQWSPRAYVVKPGECWVHPQGDPLYDEHYAKNVNLPNCEAYQKQEQAQYTEQQAKRVEWDTQQARMGVYTVLGVFVALFFLLLVAVLRGQNATA